MSAASSLFYGAAVLKHTGDVGAAATAKGFSKPIALLPCQEGGLSAHSKRGYCGLEFLLQPLVPFA
jgi:hypothetical protein